MADPEVGGTAGSYLFNWDAYLHHECGLIHTVQRVHQAILFIYLRNLKSLKHKSECTVQYVGLLFNSDFALTNNYVTNLEHEVYPVC